MLKRLSGLFALGGSFGPQIPYSGPTTATARSAPLSSQTAMTETAAFANGCFWGTEHAYREHFSKKGLKNATVGYMGGQVESPTYRAVCSGTTGHAEACKLEFDPSQVSYAELVEFFYRSHDPTTMNAQGPDRGPQYRSVIFAYSDEQMETAKKITAEVQKEHFDPKNKKIVTELLMAKDNKWWDAEAYHQEYLHHNPGGYECPTHRLHW